MNKHGSEFDFSAFSHLAFLTRDIMTTAPLGNFTPLIEHLTKRKEIEDQISKSFGRAYSQSIGINELDKIIGETLSRHPLFNQWMAALRNTIWPGTSGSPVSPNPSLFRNGFGFGSGMRPHFASQGFAPGTPIDFRNPAKKPSPYTGYRGVYNTSDFKNNDSNLILLMAQFSRGNVNGYIQEIEAMQGFEAVLESFIECCETPLLYGSEFMNAVSFWESRVFDIFMDSPGSQIPVTSDGTVGGFIQSLRRVLENGIRSDEERIDHLLFSELVRTLEAYAQRFTTKADWREEYIYVINNEVKAAVEKKTMSFNVEHPTIAPVEFYLKGLFDALLHRCQLFITRPNGLSVEVYSKNKVSPVGDEFSNTKPAQDKGTEVKQSEEMTFPVLEAYKYSIQNPELKLANTPAFSRIYLQFDEALKLPPAEFEKYAEIYAYWKTDVFKQFDEVYHDPDLFKIQCEGTFKGLVDKIYNHHKTDVQNYPYGQMKDCTPVVRLLVTFASLVHRHHEELFTTIPYNGSFSAGLHDYITTHVGDRMSALDYYFIGLAVRVESSIKFVS